MNTTQMINMRYPKELLKRIDQYQEEMGFMTRTQTIVYLIQKGLEDK